MNVKTKSFNGSYVSQKIQRRIQTIDPGTNATITDVQLSNKLDGFVIVAVTAQGEFSNTGERFIQVWGQYRPGKTAFVTISGQHLEPFAAAVLKENVEKPEDEVNNPASLAHPWYLKNEPLVCVIGDAMTNNPRQQGFGANATTVNILERVDSNENRGPVRLLLSEFYVYNEDGTVKVIIGPPAQATAKTTVESAMF